MSTWGCGSLEFSANSSPKRGEAEKGGPLTERAMFNIF